jgi:membrane peptidoglycan carboxypeptidase
VRNLLVTLLKFTAVLGAIGSVAAWWGYRHWVVEHPGDAFAPGRIERLEVRESPVTYADGTTRIGAFFDTEHQAWVAWDDIPAAWKDAIIASEDATFYEHPGFSARGIARAAWQNLKAGRVVAGGSTLTQQTAKNVFQRPDRSFRSKAGEFLNALRLEAHFSKERILELYANRFHVSANGRGIGIAARYFFDKAPAELTAKECAFLAGFVKAPTRYNPFLGETEARRSAARARAEDRTAYVLGRMVETGALTSTEADALRATPLAFKRGAFQFERSVLLDAVEARIEDPSVLAALEAAGIDNPATAGIRIVTTLDADAQRGAHYGVVHALTPLGSALEAGGMDAFVFPAGTAVPVDAGHALRVRGLHTARVTATDRKRIDLDVGGRPCAVDDAGIARITRAVAESRRGPGARADEVARSEVLGRLTPGTVVLASVRPGATGTCDLEARPALQGALVVVDAGRVLAMVGGGTNIGYNRAVTARRQLGSTWKPLVYEAALDLGWLPDDLLDNRRAAFPFRGVWYYPQADHVSAPWVSMIEAAQRSENLASTWLLAHLLDRATPGQVVRLAGAAGLLPAEGESADAWTARLRDREGIPSPVGRLDELAFTAARDEVLATLTDPREADALRSLAYGRGVAAERARLARTPDTPERAERLGALDRTYLALVETLAQLPAAAAPVAPAEPSAADATVAADAPAPAATVAGWTLVDGEWRHEALRQTTLLALRDAHARSTSALEAADPWAPETLALDPEFRTLVAIRTLQTRLARRGVETRVPTTLALPLGAGELSLAEMALAYAPMLRGEATLHGADGAGRPLEVIDRILDTDGTVIWQSRPAPSPVLDPRVGYRAGTLLRAIVRGGTGASAEGSVTIGGAAVPLAGKTGTTNEYRNAAFVGFVPRYGPNPLAWGDALTVAAWVGYDDNRPMRRGRLRLQGANSALVAWRETARALAEANLLGAGGAPEWADPSLDPATSTPAPLERLYSGVPAELPAAPPDLVTEGAALPEGAQVDPPDPFAPTLAPDAVEEGDMMRIVPQDAPVDPVPEPPG